MGTVRRVIVVGVCILASLAMAAGDSAAYQYEGVFSTGEGSEPGQLEAPGRAAVEQSTGNLFVVDSGNDRVQVFKPNAAGTADYLTSFGVGELSEPWGIAIAEGGGQTSVYVADAGNGRIVKFDSDEAQTPSFSADASFVTPSQGSGSGEVGSFAAALAIDPTSGHLLVADTANKLIQRFEADGDFVSAFDGSNGAAAFAGPIDLAVNSAGDVYVIDANGPDIAKQEGTSQVLRYSGAGEYKATLGPVGTHERPAAMAVNPRNDEVVVTGDQDAVYEAGPPPFVPVIQAFDASNNPLPSPAAEVTAQYDTVSGLAIGSGDEDHLYVAFDVGYYFGSPYGTPQIQVFSQELPAPPDIVSSTAAPQRTEAELRAVINPRQHATSYRFEYGGTAAYGSVTAEKAIPTGPNPVEVSADLTGLEPGTTYHFRVVATNALGTSEGPGLTFTTDPPLPPETCPNVEIRIQQGTTRLPDCRAYELVSPPVKFNGGAVLGLRTRADGEATSFVTNDGAFLFTPYVAHRTATGWSSATATPPSRVQRRGNGATGVFIPDFTNDFEKAFVFTNDYIDDDDREPVEGGDEEKGWDLYTFSPRLRTHEWLSRPVPERFEEVVPGTFMVGYGGRSVDGRHVVFGSSRDLVGGGLTDFGPGSPLMNLYESVDGELRFVAIRPDGTPEDAPTLLASGTPTPEQLHPAEGSQAISDDGRRIFWTTVGTQTVPLYMREDGETTIALSASRRAENPGELFNGAFIGATADGSRAYFYSPAPLTDDAPTGGVYRWDRAGNQLTFLLSLDAFSYENANIVFPTGNDVRIFSEASERLIFSSADVLLPGAVAGEANLYVLENDEDLRLIAPLTRELPEWNYTDRRVVVSPDGELLAFTTATPLTESHAAGINAMYVHDLESGETRCATCPTDGTKTVGHASFGPPLSRFAVASNTRSTNPRGFGADGRLYFQANDGLVPEDVNGAEDVYAYSMADDEAELISSGTGPGSSISDISEDGSSVFFLTEESLVPQDVDNGAPDIYVSRVGGGFLAPPDAGGGACRDDSCQGAPSGAAAGPAIGSLQLGSRRRPTEVRMKVRGAKRVFTVPTARLRVAVPGPGRLSVSGPSVEKGSRTASRAKVVSLTVRLDRAARMELAAGERVQATVNLSFSARDGGSATRTLTLTFDRPSASGAKGGRR